MQYIAERMQNVAEGINILDDENFRCYKKFISNANVCTKYK